MGFHSAISVAMAAKRSLLAWARMTVSGWACSSKISPTATPMRFSPKSKANIVPSVGGQFQLIGIVGKTDTECAHGRGQTLFERQTKEDVRLGGYGQPGILPELIFQLSGRPAGVAECDQYFARITFAADRLQDVARTGEADVGIDGQRRLPAAKRAVQDKAAVGLNRATEVDRESIEVVGVERDINFFEECRQRHVDRAVYNHAQCPLLVMLADINQRTGEIGVGHCRHGNEKMVSQVA